MVFVTLDFIRRQKKKYGPPCITLTTTGNNCSYSGFEASCKDLVVAYGGVFAFKNLNTGGSLSP